MDKIVIDFESLNTNIYKLGSGLVLSEPTVIAISSDGKNNVKAIGSEAKKLIGKTANNTKIVFPVFEGEIVNEKAAVKLLSAFLDKIEIKNGSSVMAIMSLPCGLSAESIEKYRQVAKGVGIKKVYFIEAPLLVAFSQKMPVTDSIPSFIIDMAGGVTNIATVSSDGVIVGVSVNFGVNKITTDIIDFIAENYGLQIGLLTAERLKTETGSLAENDGLSTVINGRDVKMGSPRALSVKAMDIQSPIKDYYDKIIEIALSVLVKLPPEVSAEIRNSGIYLSGIGANIYGLHDYFAHKFDMPINISDNPEYAVTLGGGKVVSDNNLVNKLSLKIN